MTTATYSINIVSDPNYRPTHQQVCAAKKIAKTVAESLPTEDVVSASRTLRNYYTLDQLTEALSIIKSGGVVFFI